MELLFFDLIRVAIGTQERLPYTPTVKEWKSLYDMAMKQSLVGVCFAGVQKLCNFEIDDYCGMNEWQYLTWMGMAAKIQQRNQIVDEQCVHLQKRLSADGFRSALLKGQGVASLYDENLCSLRQSGDIDVWVQGGINKVLDYCNSTFDKVEWDYINAHVPVFEQTEVEIHWRPQALTNLCANKKLQRWFAHHEDEILGGTSLVGNENVVVPTVEFNAFYILLHCYHHMFECGLGLRQLMDYYFVLCARGDKNENKNLIALFDQFGMTKFASGVMWIMKEVFGISEEVMIGEIDEHEGRFLLNEVVKNGNFGHHDDRIKMQGNGKVIFLCRSILHNMHLASHYPAELFLSPVWLVYHWCWKRFGKL